MKYRKLRIAWSVCWGVVVLMLCVLWVRSTKNCESCRFSWKGHSLHVQSARGKVIVFHTPYPVTWKAGSFLLRRTGRDDVLKTPIIGTANSIAIYGGWTKLMVAPYWVALLTTAALASLLWLRHLRWRFSLRTLLIVTTLVAIVLGVIVWATR